MITIVDMNNVVSVKPLISEVLFESIKETISRGEKVLLLLNRRWAMSTFLCRDCGWCARCPSCDLMIRVHTRPEHCLLCHFCETKLPIMGQCPKCKSYNLHQSGSRVQSIEVSVRELFPDQKILLIEDLSVINNKILAENTLFIGTQKISTLPVVNLWLTSFLLVESDLAVPDFDIEESLYSQIRYFVTRSEKIILQTRSPKIPIIADVTHGNFRSFFQRTLKERKLYGLPPFKDLVMIFVNDTSESIVKQRIASMASTMIEQAKIDGDTSVTYDHLLVEKRGGKYRQKIMIRSSRMISFLEIFRAQLVRWRGIEVEWL